MLEYHRLSSYTIWIHFLNLSRWSPLLGCRVFSCCGEILASHRCRESVFPPPFVAFNFSTSDIFQLDIVTLFVWCENDWCADLQSSQTNVQYATVTAPNPNLLISPQSAHDLLASFLRSTASAFSAAGSDMVACAWRECPPAGKRKNLPRGWGRIPHKR